jgi:hypothetical protein
MHRARTGPPGGSLPSRGSAPEPKQERGGAHAVRWRSGPQARRRMECLGPRAAPRTVVGALGCPRGAAPGGGGACGKARSYRHCPPEGTPGRRAARDLEGKHTAGRPSRSRTGGAAARGAAGAAGRGRGALGAGARELQGLSRSRRSTPVALKGRPKREGHAAVGGRGALVAQGVWMCVKECNSNLAGRGAGAPAPGAGGAGGRCYAGRADRPGAPRSAARAGADGLATRGGAVGAVPPPNSARAARGRGARVIRPRRCWARRATPAARPPLRRGTRTRPWQRPS